MKKAIERLYKTCYDDSYSRKDARDDLLKIAEKLEEKKPAYISDFGYCDAACPECWKIIRRQWKYCPECGQKIKWEE